MPEMIVKRFTGLEIKDADRGEVEAVVATFGVVDRDGDVILHDAIPDGAKVAMSGFGHDTLIASQPPVGAGRIETTKESAVFKGRLFLGIQRGREAFELLKEMSDQLEWSWGFHVIESEQPDDEWREKGAVRVLSKTDTFEVSPVLRGAGIGTRTMSVKEGKDENNEPEPDTIEKALADRDAAKMALKSAERRIRALEEADRELAKHQRTQRWLQRHG